MWPISSLWQTDWWHKEEILHGENRKVQFLKSDVQWAGLTPWHHWKGKLPSLSLISFVPSWVTYSQYVPHARAKAHQTQLLYLVKAADHQPTGTSRCSPSTGGRGKVLPGRGQDKTRLQWQWWGRSETIFPATVRPFEWLSCSWKPARSSYHCKEINLLYFSSSGADRATPT